MEKYQKHGINPFLISIATGQEVNGVLERPTVATLPGKYPRHVYKYMKEINREFPENIFRLKCKACGKNGDYDLGTLVLPTTDKNILESFQAVGYFRCKHCNAAGEWELSQHMQTVLAGKMAAAAIENKVKDKVTSGVIFGQALIDSEFAPRWGSEAETYFLNKLFKNPQDVYLWNRLGNIYYKGKRPELAVCAYEQALFIELGQVESHFSLGQILLDCGEFESAAEHLRQAVAFAHQYTALSAYDLREIIVGALTVLINIYNQSGKKIDMLPRPSELAVAHYTQNQVAATTNFDFEINTNRRETLYPLAEVYMGIRRNELSEEDRATRIPRLKVAWPVTSKVNKQKPAKKNRKRK
jgi:tetratricopeptide (TPR) repeat protein